MKLCVDCKWYQEGSEMLHDQCRRMFPEPVRGGSQTPRTYYAWSRRDPNGVCGPSAAGFEPKQENTTPCPSESPSN